MYIEYINIIYTCTLTYFFIKMSMLPYGRKNFLDHDERRSSVIILIKYVDIETQAYVDRSRTPTCTHYLKNLNHNHGVGTGEDK